MIFPYTYNGSASLILVNLRKIKNKIMYFLIFLPISLDTTN